MIVKCEECNNGAKVEIVRTECECCKKPMKFYALPEENLPEQLEKLRFEINELRKFIGRKQIGE